MSEQLAELKLEEIEFGNRFRETYNVDELVASLKSEEQIQPIAVKRIPSSEQSNGKKYLLLAGGKRYVAHKRMEKPTILARIYPEDLSDLQYRKIELAENYYREQLPWQTEVKLVEEIHRLETGEDPKHTLEDTAELIGKKSPATVSEDIKIARAMQKVPELEKCKTKKEAVRALNRTEENIIKKELARRIEDGQTKIGKGGQELAESYRIGDTFELSKKVPDNSMDFIDCDPPYGINMKGVLEAAGADGMYDSIDEKGKEETVLLYYKTLQVCSRVLKNNRYGVLWASMIYYTQILKCCEKVGLKTFQSPCIWFKGGKFGRSMNPDKFTTLNYEPMIIFYKGDPRLSIPGAPAVFTCKPELGDTRRHPTQKPFLLMDAIMKVFCAPSYRVFVPFLGSGMTLIAAYLNNCKAFGFEKQENFKNSFVMELTRLDDYKALLRGDSVDLEV